MTRTLRPWQREAVDAVHARWADGTNRTAVIAATGLGKSSVIGHLAVEEVQAGGRVLLLAHREELLEQLADTCRKFDPSVPVGIIQAARNETRRPILVGSVPTLRNEARQARTPRPTMIVVDECHRAVSPSHLKVLRWAGAFDGVRTLGVTATMSRGDKLGLGDVWGDEPALVRDIAYGIDRGYLVAPRGRVVVGEHMDLNRAKIKAGDYQDAELGEMVSQDVDQIVKAWCEHAADRITVAFTPTVASGEALTEAFTAAGVPAELVTGKTKTPARKAMYTRLAAGETRVLVNVFVLVEGWDAPPVSCILMARPTKLSHVYIQAVGRGLRQHPGKADCLVLDVVGASRTQRLVTLVDLHPTAHVDTTELDALPCEECGGWLGRFAPPELAHLGPCSCPSDPIERDPDGGRRRLLGPAIYDDVDLFASSDRNWLRTRGGLRFLPAGDRVAVLWPDSGKPDSPTWSVGHVNVRGARDGCWIDANVPHSLAEATALAEVWASDYDPSTSARKASWRGGRPSDKQVEYAGRLGIAGAVGMNKARLSDEISIVLASRRLDVVQPRA